MSAKVVSLYQAGQPSPYHLPAPQSRSADLELAQATPQLRNWARHLASNSSIIRAVLDSRVSNGIGTGLTYEPLVRDRSGTLLTDVNNSIRRVIDDWRKKPDVTGELCGGELERLAWRSWDTDGEIFARKVMRNGPTFPYQIQLLESDQVPSGIYGGTTWVDGVEQDEWGAPIAYYAYRRRPDLYARYDNIGILDDLIRLPADDVYHLKRMIRPYQTRGLTLVHAVIFRVADISEYAQSHRLAARASADLFASINRGPNYETPKNPDGTDVGDNRDWQFEHLQMIDGLAPDEQVNFHDPQHPNVNATDFLHEELRQIAAGTRCSFSQIANVFDRAYAAQRLEIVHAWRLVQEDRSQFIADFARPALYEEPLKVAIASGALQIPRRGIDPNTLYDCRIEGPVMPTIDPVKDRQADEMDQLNGWDSRHAIIRQRGRRPADVDAEIERDTFVQPGTQEQMPLEVEDDAD